MLSVAILYCGKAFPARHGYTKKTLWSRSPVPADASGASGFAGQASQAGEVAPMVGPQSKSIIAAADGKPAAKHFDPV